MFGNLVKPLNRHQWISEAAYFNAEARGFEPGQEADDWLRAEIAYSKMLIRTYLSVLEEDHMPITLYGLKQLAAIIGVQYADAFMSTVELIHAIQNVTQHAPCFRVEPNKHCEETVCEWRMECQKLISIRDRYAR
ncbi:DUF2934 domain-containing protein [Methylococcaceae bacterium WWC4]|nr:DUF2934 domain-containing protein [Methylococcaceae bacterium WWC4]